jgi:hypothetical protein
VNIILWLINLHMPDSVKRRGLRQLYGVTAAAFGVHPSYSRRDSYEAELIDFALFTQSTAGRALQCPASLRLIQSRLYEHAKALGYGLRRQFRVRNRQEALEAVRLVYRAIGVDIRADTDGSILVNRCFFADYYSADVCNLISSLDAGIFAGLTGGHHLSFSERITDDCPYCRATVSFSEVKP